VTSKIEIAIGTEGNVVAIGEFKPMDLWECGDLLRYRHTEQNSNR
jgi:hypothetical protein